VLRGEAADAVVFSLVARDLEHAWTANPSTCATSSRCFRNTGRRASSRR
jgi:hypothetical protein